MPAQRRETDLVQVALRLREGLRQQVVREAKKNRVPINRELHRRIEESFKVGAIRSIEEVAADLVSAHRKTLVNS